MLSVDNYTVGDSISSFGEIRLEVCNMCAQECLVRCCQEHPEWLTPKSKRVSVKHAKDVEKYVCENTEKVPCLVSSCFCEYEYYEGDEDIESVCEKHLLQRLTALREARPKEWVHDSKL
jgi:hypothetical protein